MDSATVDTMTDITPLAVQIAFAVNEMIEDDVEPHDEHDMPMPPTRWSPNRAMAMWDALPDDVQQAWLDYARKVHIFAGVPSNKVRAAAMTLAEFARTAPGRLPSRVGEALAVIDPTGRRE